MAYSKPQVTIDLDEYNELLRIKAGKEKLLVDGDKFLPIEEYTKMLNVVKEISASLIRSNRDNNHEQTILRKKGIQICLRPVNTSRNYDDLEAKDILFQLNTPS